jgi:hypothetical protein
MNVPNLYRWDDSNKNWENLTDKLNISNVEQL